MSEITIKSIETAGGATRFVVAGRINGERRRERYKTEVEALNCKQNWEREQMNAPTLAAVITRLSEEQVRQAETAFHRLEGQPLTITQAIDYALENYKISTKTTTVRAGVDLFLDDKRGLNRRDKSVANLEQRLGALPKAKGGLVKEYGDRLAHELTPDQIKPLIFIEGTSARNQHNQYLAFSNLFGWLTSKGYVAKNPLAEIDDLTVDDAEPVALSIEQSRRLMKLAETFEAGALVPSVALCLFCGIRPEQEMARLALLPRGGWEKINLEAKVLILDGTVTKKRKRRVVALPENAIEWLRPHALKRTPIVSLSTSHPFTRLRALAGFCPARQTVEGQIPWTPDVLRHTAISFHLAKHENEGATAAWAGNSPDVIHDKYKSLVTNPSDIADFYDILPNGVVLVKLDDKKQVAKTAQK